MTTLENPTLTGSDTINGLGNEWNNIITGNSNDNSLSGAAGADTLIGGAGNDTLMGGRYLDSLTGGLGDDTYRSISRPLERAQRQPPRLRIQLSK